MSTATPTVSLPPVVVEAPAKMGRAIVPQPEMSEADRLAHELASYVRRPVQAVAL